MSGIAGLLITLLLISSPALAYQTENVVLVIIDGLRYTEGLGDPDHEFVPEMAALAEEGTIIEPFLNDGITYTSRAIPAIWCGAWTDIHEFSDPDCGGQSNNYCELPTVFEYYRQQLGRPQNDCIYVLKDVGCPWKASFDADYGPEYWPLYHSVGYSDLDVWNEAVEILDTYAPTFFLLYLADVDHEGHSGDWGSYTHAITIADGIVGMLWDYLQADPDYAGTTSMFVTNDHGRHDYDFSGHGDDCDGCRTIQLLAVGPDVESGVVSQTPRTLRDITPTIGELLGFVAEDATGEVMMEILESVPDSVEDQPEIISARITPAPSPFTEFSQLQVALPAPDRVKVRIYDIRGELVATPYDGPLSGGLSLIPWDGRTDEGRILESGIYFATLKTLRRTTSHRIVLLR